MTDQVCKDCKQTFSFPADSADCANCWEVKRRLEEFVQSKENLEWAKKIIAEAESK